MILFFIWVISASFNIFVPINRTIPYMILEALDIDHKDGTSKKFKIILSVSIFIGMFSPLVSHVTGLSVVQMVTLFSAFNGVFLLPFSSIFLFFAFYV